MASLKVGMEPSANENVDARAMKRIGTTLRGKYRLDSVLGIGGMAIVYAATRRNKKELAVKMLHAELSMHEDLRTRFLREGYVANSVGHEGAVSVLDDDVAEDSAYVYYLPCSNGLITRFAAKTPASVPSVPPHLEAGIPSFQ